MQKTFLVKNSHLKNFGPYAKLHRKPQIQGQGRIREGGSKSRCASCNFTENVYSLMNLSALLSL